MSQYLWARCLPSVSGGKLMFCMMRKGVGFTPLLLEKWPLDVQEEGEGCKCPSNSQLSTETPTSQKTSTRTHIQAFTDHSSHTTLIPLTHTPPWCRTPWSRFLDDIVKQLHGLHDVLILFA